MTTLGPFLPYFELKQVQDITSSVQISTKQHLHYRVLCINLNVDMQTKIMLALNIVVIRHHKYSATIQSTGALFY